MSPSPPSRAAALGLVFAAAAALALGLWWFLGAGGGSEADARAGDTGRAPSAAPELAPIADDADSLRPGANAFRSQPTAVEREAVCEDKALKFSGRLIVTDVNGAQDLEADGALELVGWTPRRSERLRAIVKDGAWSAEFFNAEELVDFSIGAVELGERAVSIESPEGRFFANAEREISVHVRVWPRTTLRVLDAATGADLEDVLLLASPSHDSLGVAPPTWDDPARRIASGLRSPIDLGALRARFDELRVSRLLVIAPGFMWSATNPDFERPLVRTVSLQPGGDLSVRVLGLEAGASERVSLTRDGKTVDVYTVTADAPLELRGLLPAIYEVSIAQESPFLLADVTPAEVEVRRGRRAQVELAVPVTPLLEQIVGRLHVPNEWGFVEPRVSLWTFVSPRIKQGEIGVALRALEPQLAGHASFEWRASVPRELGLGLFVQDAAYWVEFDGRDDPRIAYGVVVPPPVELVVHVVDRATREEVATPDMTWSLHGPGIHLVAADGGFVMDPTGRGRLARVPAGRVIVRASADGYQTGMLSLKLESDRVEALLQLDR
jgi:hypothetical protein